MSKLIIAMGCAAFAVASPAQEALQCANPDVLNALVFNARPESKLVVTRTLPANPAGFAAPADFKLIGSGVRGQSLATVVAYRTSLETGKAFDDLLGLLAEQGWKREATQQPQQPMVSVAGQQPTVRVCRNGERRNVLVQELAGVRYATISGFGTNPPRACDAPVPQQNLGGFNPMAALNAAQAMMPQFSFPATARMSAAANPGVNSNFGSGSFATATRIESPDTAASLARLLARQLGEQGWRRDAEWNGALSTGSTWTRAADDGKPYWGTLEILSLGAGSYDIAFVVAGRPR
jgi:hypothetical protein